MRFAAPLALGFLLVQALPRPSLAQEAAAPALTPSQIIVPTPPRSRRPAFLCLPNGWGNTPQAARRDLDRVMKIYEDKPGFVRFAYVKIVPVGRNSYEADGMCTWDAPDLRPARAAH